MKRAYPFIETLIAKKDLVLLKDLDDYAYNLLWKGGCNFDFFGSMPKELFGLIVKKCNDFTTLCLLSKKLTPTIIANFRFSERSSRRFKKKFAKCFFSLSSEECNRISQLFGFPNAISMIQVLANHFDIDVTQLPVFCKQTPITNLSVQLIHSLLYSKDYDFGTLRCLSNLLLCELFLFIFFFLLTVWCENPVRDAIVIVALMKRLGYMQTDEKDNVDISNGINPLDESRYLPDEIVQSFSSTECLIFYDAYREIAALQQVKMPQMRHVNTIELINNVYKKIESESNTWNYVDNVYKKNESESESDSWDYIE